MSDTYEMEFQNAETGAVERIIWTRLQWLVWRHGLADDVSLEDAEAFHSSWLASLDDED